MKKYNFKEIKSIAELMTSIMEDDSYLEMSLRDIIKLLTDNNNSLLEQWVNSNRTDFSIYPDERYNQAGLYCYHIMTKRSLHECMKYIMNNLLNANELTFFDDYNGIGISTIYLMLQGLNVSFMNDNDNQIDIFKRLCDLHGVKLPFNDRDRKKKYDVVLSFEVAEHYQKPVSYINSLIDMVKPGGYLIISSSMNYPEAPGHFLEYEIDDINYDNKKASRFFNRKIKEKMTQVHRGWNGTPLFFKKEEN